MCVDIMKKVLDHNYKQVVIMVDDMDFVPLYR